METLFEQSWLTAIRECERIYEQVNNPITAAIAEREKLLASIRRACGQANNPITAAIAEQQERLDVLARVYQDVMEKLQAPAIARPSIDPEEVHSLLSGRPYIGLEESHSSLSESERHQQREDTLDQKDTLVIRMQTEHQTRLIIIRMQADHQDRGPTLSLCLISVDH